MSTFIFYWNDGSIDVQKAYSVAEAFTLLGYGFGALGALDHYEEVNDDDAD